jgi:hypothetical protein
MALAGDDRSAIVRFLGGDGLDAAGRSFADVVAMDDHAIERHHDFIQWLFPLDEPSKAVPSSPVLTPADIALLRASAMAQRRLGEASARMLRFYRMTARWRQSFDHNHLRITRIIKSLRLLAGDAAAEAFKAAILDEASGTAISVTALRFWEEA